MAKKRLSLAEATIAYRKQEVVPWSKNHNVSEEIGKQIDFISDFVFGEPGQMGRFLLRSSRRLIQVVSYEQNGN